MSIASASTSPFEQLTAQAGDELAATALALAAHAGADERLGSLIVVVHPEREDYRVLADAGIGVLRAAVSVAVASGHDRLWADAPTNDTIEHAVRSLPEVIRAAAEAGQIEATHTGVIRVDGRLEAVAIWFESKSGVASVTERRDTLELLTAAAERDAERATQSAADQAAATAALDADLDDATADGTSQPGRRDFDPGDPDLDPLTGVVNLQRFERALESHDSDQATLIILDIDHFGQIIDECGSEVADQVLFEVADRLLAACRKSDLVARIGTDTFAVLFGDVDRSTALQISKRLLSRIAEPLATAPHPEMITATVALAHQFGLVDTDELFESATDALRSGKKIGRGRLFVGS